MSGSEPPVPAGGRPRVPLGVAGLDAMLRGGVPQGSVVLVTGLPGTGKTCLGLGFLAAGIRAAEPGLFLSLEEEAEMLLETARQFGWPLDDAVARGTLQIHRLDPRETHQSLRRIQGSLGSDLRRIGPRRIVVDSVSLLEMLCDGEATRRETLFALAGACRDVGATTLLIAEADPIHPEVTRDGLAEYVADGVLVLGYSQTAEGRRVGLSVRILKMRRTDHVRSAQPYTFGRHGIEVDANAVDFGRFV
ncbi:MAG: ATPase domain-containing protein [Thermoplasmata archaeon]